MKLIYIFDPLCGWCYGSSRALGFLVENYAKDIELLPSGLFSGAGAKTLSADFATHAWRNDQRIADLTGLVFSDNYLKLLNSGVEFDSTYLNRVLTLFSEVSIKSEEKALSKLQQARYYLGLNTADANIIANVVVELAQSEGLNLSEQKITGLLLNDDNLQQKTASRHIKAQHFIQNLGIHGVPALIQEVDGRYKIISNNFLYGSLEQLTKELES